MTDRGSRAPTDSPSRAADTRLRGALLLPLCALIVHQLRFSLAFGANAHARLLREGHAYLATIEPLALLATALAAGVLIGSLARQWNTAGGGRAVSVPARSRLLRLWAVCAGVLIVIYCAQELLEGAFASGHPAGLTGIFGAGGWIAGPLAVIVGGLLALTLRVAEQLAASLAARRHPVYGRGPLSMPRRGRSASDWRLFPGSGVSAGRAPPATFAA